MHRVMLAESEQQSWIVNPHDYFHNMKRYYKFKAVSGMNTNVEVVFDTVDLECKYDYVQYYASDDCNDDVAKEMMYRTKDTRTKDTIICNTVSPTGGSDYPYTQGPVKISGKCIYVKLYSH